MPVSQPNQIAGLKPYAGRWVARLGQRIVGQGGTPDQAMLAAKALRFKETPQVIFVPTTQPLSFLPILEKIAQAMPANKSAYLVGGAVRDALLGRAGHDLDFVVPTGGIALGRKLADALETGFFPMDEAHDTARLFLSQPDGSRVIVDICSFRGPDLESDLRARDFTINAMAVEIRRPQELLDPLGGATDLRAKTLRACSDSTFTDDPLRILRAIRQAAALGLRIHADTRTLMRQSVNRLGQVSPERLRDELFRMLDGPSPDACLRALDLLGVLPHILPELPPLKGLQQSPPHVSDVWTHTLNTLKQLDALLKALQPDYDPDQAANLTLGLAVLRLGRYRQQLSAHLSSQLNADRSLRPLLFLSALYHDTGKASTQTTDDSGRVRYFDHDTVGEKLAVGRGRALRLSNLEIERIGMVVRHHMRPLLLGQAGEIPSRRAIYRFFRRVEAAGVDICLLSLADFLATYGTTPPPEAWARHLDIVRALLEAWWEKPEESVRPADILNGSELMALFDLPAGPQIGHVLEAVREATATGQIRTRDEALTFVREMLDQRR